jgi:3-deoxy-7-phosphoheptulonate synthase
MIVSTDVSEQIAGGNTNIMGVMVESHLAEGRYDLVDSKGETYG